MAKQKPDRFVWAKSKFDECVDVHRKRVIHTNHAACLKATVKCPKR